MGDKIFKKAVISSFFNAKTHISSLEIQIESLKSLILRQNDIIKQLTERVITLTNTPKIPENKPFFYSSTGNDGVKQSINQSINQTSNQALSTKEIEIPKNNESLSTSHLTLSNQIPVKDEKNQDLGANIPIAPISTEENTSKAPIKEEKISQIILEKELVKQLKEETKFTPEISEEIEENFIAQNRQKHVKTAQKDILDENFKAFKQNLNQAFNKLSKQELKAFLTVYQLDESNQGASYQEVAEKMGLTETCVRAYISSLFKKGIPLTKVKINNKRTIVSIKQDFKNLNLKAKIIALYYEKDPYQTSIFDINS